MSATRVLLVALCAGCAPAEPPSAPPACLGTWDVAPAALSTEQAQVAPTIALHVDGKVLCTDNGFGRCGACVLDFHDVPVGAARTAPLVVVGGNHVPLQIHSAEWVGCSDIALAGEVPTDVEADGQADLPIAFTPTEADACTAQLRIVSDAANVEKGELFVEVRGVGVDP